MQKLYENVAVGFTTDEEKFYKRFIEGQCSDEEENAKYKEYFEAYMKDYDPNER